MAWAAPVIDHPSTYRPFSGLTLTDLRYLAFAGGEALACVNGNHAKEEPRHEGPPECKKLHVEGQATAQVAAFAQGYPEGNFGRYVCNLRYPIAPYHVCDEAVDVDATNRTRLSLLPPSTEVQVSGLSRTVPMNPVDGGSANSD